MSIARAATSTNTIADGEFWRESQRGGSGGQRKDEADIHSLNKRAGGERPWGKPEGVPSLSCNTRSRNYRGEHQKGKPLAEVKGDNQPEKKIKHILTPTKQAIGQDRQKKGYRGAKKRC